MEHVSGDFPKMTPNDGGTHYTDHDDSTGGSDYNGYLSRSGLSGLSWHPPDNPNNPQYLYLRIVTIMPMSMLTTKKVIRARHSVREDFAGVSTGSGSTGYYESKGHALRTFEGVLEYYGLCFDPTDFFDMPGDDGRIGPGICVNEGDLERTDSYNKHVGRASISWHRMESGRYEFTGYIT